MNAAWTVRIVGWLPLPTLGILACTVPPRAPVSRTEQQVPPGEHRTPAAPRNEPGHLHQEAAPNLPELASPDIVLPADRLHERVDGALGPQAGLRSDRIISSTSHDRGSWMK